MIDQAAPQPPPAERQFSVLAAIPGVVTNPVATMRDLATFRPWLASLGIYIVIAVLTGLANSLGINIDAMLAQIPAESRRDIEPALPAIRALFSPVTFITASLVSAPISLAITAGIFWIVGRLLGGTGAFSAMFSTQAFAAVPTVITAAVTALVGLLASVAGAIGIALSPLASLVGFGIGIWVLVLSVIGIRETMGFSTGRAIATLLIPLAVFILACCCLWIAGIASIAAIVGNSFQR